MRLKHWPNRKLSATKCERTGRIFKHTEEGSRFIYEEQSIAVATASPKTGYAPGSRKRSRGTQI